MRDNALIALFLLAGFFLLSRGSKKGKVAEKPLQRELSSRNYPQQPKTSFTKPPTLSPENYLTFDKLKQQYQFQQMEATITLTPPSVAPKPKPQPGPRPILKGINIAYILSHCDTLIGKEVELKATYKGWHCPKNCRNPAITRSDTCWIDNTGCIYSVGFGGLSPLKDVGQTHIIRAIVEKTANGICYLKITKILNESKINKGIPIYREPVVDNEILVKLKTPLDKIRLSQGKYIVINGYRFLVLKKYPRFSGDGALLLVKPEIEMQKALRILRSSPIVKYAEPNRVIRLPIRRWGNQVVF
jgi:predicted RNA-binding Zn-ribbon protein involved in translation (DUF1610 family)